MNFPLVDKRGFTLVELVTIIVLLGILAVMALPRMFDATAFRGRGFLDEVANAARYAQKLAVASGCEVRLSIDNDNDSYALHQRGNSCTSGGFVQDVPHPAGSGAFTGNAPSGVDLWASEEAIIFNALGRATSGDVTVTVGGRNFTIVGESGYVDGL